MVGKRERNRGSRKFFSRGRGEFSKGNFPKGRATGHQPPAPQRIGVVF